MKKHFRLHAQQGFNLLEVMIAMFILGLGMIMIAGSLPVALRQSAVSQDMSISSFAARFGNFQSLQFAHRDQLPIFGQTGAIPCVTTPLSAAQSSVHWFGPATDRHANGYVDGSTGNFVSYNQPRWFRNDPAGWGEAIPFRQDDRYAYQIFYRRLPINPADPNGTVIYNVSYVVQVKRDERFYRPLDRGFIASLSTGDLYCTTTGEWRQFKHPSQAPAMTFGWGIPGSIGVFQTTLSF